MHTCIHDWTLEDLSKQINLSYPVAAVCAIGDLVKYEYDDQYWVSNTLLLPHARRLQHPKLYAALDHVTSVAVLRALGNISDLWCIERDYPTAGSLIKEALRRAERVLGPGHLTTMTYLLIQGNLYFEMGQLDQAEKLLRRAYAAWWKLLAQIIG